MDVTEKLICDTDRLLMGSGRNSLTAWEINFLSGIANAVKNGKYLTPRQKVIARGILKERIKNTHSTTN
ncbi:hypothetical protein [Serratia symbiotica]|uniref:hypothetical protein n=1 Tax=Serratia symbiotica TaxID=138074 RepID=UPI001CF07A39|nr:hypothetical protein [Serratia symbiotica]